MLSVLILLCAQGSAAEIVVTPKGGVAALEKAREQARARKGESSTIVLRRGDYFLTHSLEFDERDSGLTVRAEPGARLIGGERVRNWRPVTDAATLARLSPEARTQVRVAAINGLGNFTPRGFSRNHSPAHSELFVDGKRMTVARWPNEGFVRLGEPADRDPEDDGHGRKIGRLPHGFRYVEARPSTWKNDANRWVHGYWSWDWADSYERIASLDPATSTILTAAPHGLYGFRRNQRYYFLNVLEELDSPGEYYLDPAAGLVYFWPPSDLRKAETLLSKVERPLLQIRGARNLIFNGIALEATRGHGVTIEDGENVVLRNIHLRNAGNSGVVISGGRGHAVERCEIAYTGDSAIEVTGGDRAALVPAGHRVEDCNIHHMGEWVRTYNPAVKVNGVGNRVANNEIHSGPHAGILLTGNDHLIERNHIHHLAQETGDVGAIYIGRDYTERGTVIRHNYIHDLGGVGLGSMAVYLDDCASGITVQGNIFYNLKYGAFVGGGRDNRVENNIFVSCNPAVHVDARGIDPRPVWQGMVYDTMKPRLEAMQIGRPPYATRYPEIRTVLPYLGKVGGVPPEGNVIRRNVIYGSGIAIREPAKPFVKEVSGNVTLEDATFFVPATGAYRLPAGTDFDPIPVESIGPRKP